MANTVLLLGPNDMSKFTNLSGNIDIDKLTPHIYTAQITKIKQILGAPLYEKILTDYSADTLTGEYEIIYQEFVVDMLVYFASGKYMTFAPYQIDNGGVYRHVPENSTPVEFEETKHLVTNFNQLGSAIELMFLDYMKGIDIPEWPKDCCSRNNNNFYFPWRVV